MPEKKSTNKKAGSSPERAAKKKSQQADDRAAVKSGMIVNVHERVIDVTPKGEPRERIQIFTGMVLARKHGSEPGASITVRKDSDGISVEKIFPIFSPLVERIVIEKTYRVRRSKLYYLRDAKKKLKEVK